MVSNFMVQIARSMPYCGDVYAFYRYRVQQIKKQQQIRKDIAGDLHDDIGSTLNTVKIFTHLAKKDPTKEEYFSRIEESLIQASIGFKRYDLGTG